MLQHAQCFKAHATHSASCLQALGARLLALVIHLLLLHPAPACMQALRTRPTANCWVMCCPTLTVSLQGAWPP